MVEIIYNIYSLIEQSNKNIDTPKNSQGLLKNSKNHQNFLNSESFLKHYSGLVLVFRGAGIILE